MDVGESWRNIFASWPSSMPRRGVVVTSFDEQISFGNFLIHESMVLVERNAPDTMGARQVMVPYANIQAVKIVDVVKKESLHTIGFEGRAAAASSR